MEPQVPAIVHALGDAALERLLAEEGLSLGVRADWQDEDDDDEEQPDPSRFFQNLLEALDRRRHVVDDNGADVDPETNLHTRGHGHMDSLARTMATLLGSTLFEYENDESEDDSEMARTGGSRGSGGPPVAAAPVAAVYSLGENRSPMAENLQQSMRSALHEALMSYGGPDATSEIDLDASQLGTSQALSDTQSVRGGQSFMDTLQEDFGDPLAGILQLLGDTLTPAGQVDGGLVGLLRHLGDGGLLGNGGLDDTARHARQLGSILAGQRLSDQEIQELPKARFDNMEEQVCSICLESYKRGELLTRLNCQHCFHVSCLAEWMRQATQCPLCRADCAA